MRTIEYQCEGGHRQEVVESVHEVPKAPLCSCGLPMDWAPTKVPLGHFKYVQGKCGKDTGVYEYDYGARATWDLTVPGKIDKLEKDGRIPRDPFKEAPDHYANKSVEAL